MQVCTSCKVEKSPDDFYNAKRNTGNSGKSYECKPCFIEKSNWKKVERLYGLTKENWYEMFDAQNGECSICHLPQDPETIKMAVDHDHETGKVRSLLCHQCNTTLGLMEDRPELLRSAANYLEKHL